MASSVHLFTPALTSTWTTAPAIRTSHTERQRLKVLMVVKILDSQCHHFHVITEASKTLVACIAQNTAHATGLMAVVNVRLSSQWSTAEEAQPTLIFNELCYLFLSYSIPAHQV